MKGRNPELRPGPEAGTGCIKWRKAPEFVPVSFTLPAYDHVDRGSASVEESRYSIRCYCRLALLLMQARFCISTTRTMTHLDLCHLFYPSAPSGWQGHPDEPCVLRVGKVLAAKFSFKFSEMDTSDPRGRSPSVSASPLSRVHR